MNIKNVLMPLLLSVYHAEAELYKCVCVYIYLLSWWAWSEAGIKAACVSQRWRDFFGLSTCRMPFTRAGAPQGQSDICILVDM